MNNNKINQKPTLKDVANLAGVSVSTASRALNKRSSVKTETRERVISAAKSLYYVQVSDRTEMSYGTYRTIAIVSSGINNPYYNNIILGIEDEADHDNINLLLMTTRDDPLYEQLVVERLLTMQLEGVIMLNACLPIETLLEIQAKRDLPFTVFSFPTEHPRIANINADTLSAAQRAAAHLISLGHKKVAYLGTKNLASIQRQKGIELAFSDANIEFDSTLVINQELGNEEGGIRAIKEVLASEYQPTAVIAFNDLMAYGAMYGLYKEGLRIPDDISLIGFDDIPSSAYTTPPLTTVALPTYRMGQLAIRLIRRIQAGEDMRNIKPTTLECPLIIRESTGPVLA